MLAALGCLAVALSGCTAHQATGTRTDAPAPATAFVLTSTGEDTETLCAVALPGGRLLWSADIPSQWVPSASLVLAPRLGRAYVLASPQGRSSAAGPPPLTLIPVSLSTGAVGRPIGVGAEAWSATLAPDGTTAYVINEGTGIVDLPGPVGDSITPVDLRTGTTGRAVSVGNGPAGIAFAGAGTAWVSLTPAGQVRPVDLADTRAGPGIAIPPPGAGQGLALAPGPLAVSANGGLLAVGNLQPDLVSPAPVVNVLDLASHRWRRPIVLPGYSNAVYQVGFSPDSRHVYVSAHTRGGITDTLYIASVATGTVTQARLTGEFVAFASTPDGSTLWVAVETNNERTALLPVNATTGVPGRAVAYLPGTPLSMGL